MENIGISNACRRMFWTYTFLTSLLLCVLVSGNSNAYTVVTLSTGTPASVEKTLLAQTTTQFSASLIVNPLAANTYQVKLFGLNPNYLAPVPPARVSISTDTLSFIYGSGMMYERKSDAGLLGFYMGLCSGATNFNMVKIDSTTCTNVLGFMDQYIVSQTSGIAVVPSPPVGF